MGPVSVGVIYPLIQRVEWGISDLYLPIQMYQACCITLLGARSKDQTVWTAFVDISNAFPSVNHDLLWLKLHEKGLSGPIFDWLRKLYRDMEYVVDNNGECSEEFKARMGVLIGDPASPTLWIIFMFDFKLLPHDDDFVLMAIAISHLEHADDVVLISSSAQGLQFHLNTFAMWCSINALAINADKSWAMAFGRLPRTLPQLRLADGVVAYTQKHSYVGIILTSTNRNIFSEHYAHLATEARRNANAVLSVESVVGTLPPAMARTLYSARVDPYIINGFDVLIDVRESDVKPLQDVQHAFLRRVMGVNELSMIAPLFTELAILPVKYRRLALTLRFLDYLLSSKSRYARLALEVSIDLSKRGFASWAGDLTHALASLEAPVRIQSLDRLSPLVMKSLLKSLNYSARAHLQSKIDASDRLYLLHGHLEPSRYSPPKYQALAVRHYITEVQNQKHRVSMCRLLLNDHKLALELLRRASRAVPAIPRALRLCRFCKDKVESPEHAILECRASPDLTRIRVDAFNALADYFPILRDVQYISPASSLAILKSIIFEFDTIQIVAKFVHDALTHFYTVPVRHTHEI